MTCRIESIKPLLYFLPFRLAPLRGSSTDFIVLSYLFLSTEYTGMASAPKIDIRLQADRLCYLSRRTRFSLVVFLTLESGRPVTVIRDGGLVQLLASECIECVDTESGQRMPVLGDLNETKSESSDSKNPSLMSLEHHRADYLTFTTASSPRSYELVFNPSKLQPDRDYTIRCNSCTLNWWSHDSKEKVLEYFASQGKLPSSETPPLRCVSTGTVSFETRKDVPQPPSIDVSLSASSTISLSGNPPLEYTTTFISHATKPITVLAERQRVKATESDVEILECSTGTRVAPDMIDDGDIEGPWQREDFLRLVPEVPYVERRVFDPTIAHSGLEDLKVDNEYLLRMPKSRWTWWSFDDVDEVMRYAGERDTGSLGTVSPIDLFCRDEVKFRAVQ